MYIDWLSPLCASVCEIPAGAFVWSQSFAGLDGTDRVTNASPEDTPLSDGSWAVIAAGIILGLARRRENTLMR